MYPPIPLDPAIEQPQIFGPITPSVTQAAQQAVVMSQETSETTVDEPGEFEIEVAKIEKPVDKSNVMLFLILAVVIIIIWK